MLSETKTAFVLQYNTVSSKSLIKRRRYSYEAALDEMIISALDDYTEALANTHIKNDTGYAKSVLWNALSSCRAKMGDRDARFDYPANA